MRKKTVFTVLVSILAVFFMAGFAMAANSVTIQSDKPIVARSDCGQAGSISALMDINTVLHEGDVIRFLLQDNATVCGAIDYFLEIADVGNEVIANGANDPIQTSANAAGSDFLIFSSGARVGAAAIVSNGATTAGSNVDVGFLVQAADNGTTITLTLAVRDQANNEVAVDSTSDLTVSYTPANADDVLTIKLFDGNNNVNFFWEPADRVLFPAIYDEAITAATDVSDNVLCIDSTSVTQALVYAIPESRPVDNQYQLNFLGDYIVAQLVTAVTYEIDTACKDDICNLVNIGLAVDQQGDPIPATGTIDFGTYSTAAAAASAVDRWSSVNYCVGNTIGNGILIYKDGDTFESGDIFQVTLTVRVGATADVDEIVFDNTGVTDYWTSNNASANCDTDANPLTTVATAAPAWAFSGTAPDTNTQLTATYSVTAAEAGMNAIMLDLPTTTMDLVEVAAGQKVYVDVTLQKLPCGGAIASGTICIAELVDGCPAAGTTTIDGIAFVGDRMLSDVLHGYLGRTYAGTGNGANASLFFPYAPALADATFFTGLAVAVTGSNDVILTVTFQDALGGTATYTTPTAVASGTQWVQVLDSLTSDLVDGATALDTTQTVTVNVAATAAP
jgi:hypothetical protein